jgi:hypothetical protein
LHAVQIGAAAAFGIERLVGCRIVDAGEKRPFVAIEGDRGAEERDAIDEVGGAVDRINDPYPVAAQEWLEESLRQIIDLPVMGEEMTADRQREVWSRGGDGCERVAAGWRKVIAV